MIQPIHLLISQGITAEKREAKAEKEEAEKYQKLTQELVSDNLMSIGIVVKNTSMDDYPKRGG